MTAEEKTEDVLVGFPSPGTVTTDFLFSLTAALPNPRLVGPVTETGPFLPTLRRRLANRLLHSPQTWLLTVDTDIVFKPEDVEALLAAADAKGPGVYSAPCASLPHGSPYDAASAERVPIVRGLQEAAKFRVLNFGNLDGTHATEVPSEDTKYKWTGLGMVLVHRVVFETVGPFCFQPLTWRSAGGEDVAFSEHARAAGFKVWVVPGARPGHLKTVTIYA